MPIVVAEIHQVKKCRGPINYRRYLVFLPGKVINLWKGMNLLTVIRLHGHRLLDGIFPGQIRPAWLQQTLSLSLSETGAVWWTRRMAAVGKRKRERERQLCSRNSTLCPVVLSSTLCNYNVDVGMEHICSCRSYRRFEREVTSVAERFRKLQRSKSWRC